MCPKVLVQGTPKNKYKVTGLLLAKKLIQANKEMIIVKNLKKVGKKIMRSR